MNLDCGCSVAPGLPLSPEMVKAHYKHTFEAMIFWELMRRDGTPQDDRNLKLSQARVDFFEALDALYPEAVVEAEEKEGRIDANRQ